MKSLHFGGMNERRDFIVIMLGQGLQAVTGFVVIRLLTSLLSTEEVGQYYILLALTSFFTLLLINPVGMYINRKTHDWYRNKTIRRNLHLFSFYVIAIAVFASVLLLLLRNAVDLDVGITGFWLLVVVIGSLLFNTANVTIMTILNMLGKRLWFVAFTLLTLWIGVGLSVFFVTEIAARAEYWLLGLFLGQLVVFLTSYCCLVRSLSHSTNESRPRSLATPNWKMISPVFHFAWPLAIAVGLGWVQTQSYRFVLAHLGGLGKLGLFAVGYGVAASLMAVFWSISDRYYYPIFYGEVSTADLEGKKASWNRFVNYLFPAALVMAAFIIACAPYLTKLLVAPEFQDAERFILWGAIAELFRISGFSFSMLAYAQMKTTWLIPPAITGATSALGGVFLLAQWDPQIGTGIALVIAGFAMALHLACKLHKKITFSLPWRRIFISIALSVPLMLGLLAFDALNDHVTYIQSFIVLAIAGIYLLIAQYLMATHWLDSVVIKEGAL